MPSWTEEQSCAIEAQGRAAVVSAAAGSGKTAVLVEKLRRLLCNEENKTSADQVAVVTFTNDAAAQMKQRLTNALTEELERTGSSYIAEQLSLIPAAKISTIHSFCFELIRENAGLAGVDPEFSVMDDGDEAVLSEKARANVFGKWFSSRRDDMVRLTSFFCPGSTGTESFSRLIAPLRSKILAQRFPGDYMDGIAENYRKRPEDTAMYKEYREGLSRKLMQAGEIHDIIFERLSGIRSEKNIRLTPSVEKKLLSLKEIAVSLKDLSERVIKSDHLPELDIPLVKTVPKPIRDAVDDENTAAALDELLTYGAKLAEDNCIVTGSRGGVKRGKNLFTYEEICDDFTVHAEICGLLFELIKEILDEESQLKLEKNALGFSDAEQIACRLLCRRDENGNIVKTPLAQKLSGEYKIVMIDEFQDSTDIQELIFKMLSKDGSADIPGTNFFAVGDVKQSIYRFRCSDPRIFMKNIEQSVPYENDGSDKPAHIFLNKNFRSCQNVVDLVNYIFEGIMTRENGGIVYNEDHRLIRGAETEDDYGPAEIISIISENDTGEDMAEDYSKAEAAAVAKRIKSLLSLTIHENGVERQVLPSDICILSRTKNNFGVYAEALRAEGISSANEEGGCLGSDEVTALINMLRAVDNPTRDIALAGALMSPLFMFTAQDMGYIRSADRAGTIYGNIVRITEEEAADEIFPAGFAEKCRSFSERFGDIRKYAVSHGAEELLRYICGRCDYMSAVAVSDKNGLRVKNIRRFIAFAASYDNNASGGSNSSKGVGSFIRQLNAMIESGRDIKSESASDTGSVDIKTIHKSKGLEYPFVFLCETERQFNLRTDSPVFFSDYGIAFKITGSANSAGNGDREKDPGEMKVYRSFPLTAASEALRKSLRDEEMMLLYVALTRAKHKLFITRNGGASADKFSEFARILSDSGNSHIAVQKAGSCSEWLSVMLGPEKTAELINEGMLAAVRSDELSDESGNAPGNKEAASDAPDNEGGFSEAAAAEYDRLMRSDYDLTLAGIPAKHTVSELAKKELTEEDRIFTPAENNGLPKVAGVSAAQRGTAVHAFMQYADLEKLYGCLSDKNSLKAAISAEAQRIASQGIISSAQAKCINPWIITAFLSGKLCERMMRSEEIIRERKFLVKISDLMLDDSELMVYNGTEGMLQGVADCIFKEDGEYVLVDYKTDGHITPEALAERYSRQLRLYAAAFSLILDSPVKKAYIYSFSLGKEIELTV